MITLTLLHPIQSIPVQSWTFEQDSVVRIGRSTDNHVILYSAVVSRHHVELRKVDSHWEIVNLGANGTYLDGKRITQVPVEDGVIIRLARSGPNIQIHIGPSASKASQGATGENTLAQRIKLKATETLPEKEDTGELDKAEPSPVIPTPITIQPESDEGEAAPKLETPDGSHPPMTAMEGENPAPAEVVPGSSKGLVNCSHPRARGDVLFCPDCGQPLQTLQTVGEYQVIKTLSQTGIGFSQLVWRNGQSLLLKTLNPDWVTNSVARDLFEQQAKRLIQLRHPGIPQYMNFFVENEQPYLVREQVYGQDLYQHVKRKGVLPQAEAIAVIQQVCEVLDYLHQQSPPFLHEDLKPENLILQPLTVANPKITVVGFVSLKSLETDDQLSPMGYTAPEQQQGQATPASDLFALGPILLYLLTGKEPIEFYAQQEEGFRLYPESASQLSPELITIIRKLTNPHPSDRYTNAREVAEGLNQVR
ncbi:protein kinase [Kovacikia minuta CCNUW1]|uniref:protein kinase domain-containing protein n=1 Tax=Kovacikia minuta TaxID=2931930 RepID=UPI001CC9680D|nr:protein kinase [Kovacikia minuta]UBF27880.1 protein kinase [Kovacikia minuta CCNUW1]